MLNSKEKWECLYTAIGISIIIISFVIFFDHRFYPQENKISKLRDLEIQWYERELKRSKNE